MKELNKLIKGKVRFNENMSRHTTFKIGGTVEGWAEPKDSDDLRNMLKFARRRKNTVYIIGGGSNLLVNNRKIKGIAVHLPFKDIEINGNRIKVGAGASLRSLLDACAKKGLSGLEFCSGIPGTVGGAVCMNAGSSPRNPNLNIGNYVTSATVMDRAGKVNIIKKKDLRFGYRSSSLSQFIILDVELKLLKTKKDYVRKRSKLMFEKKKRTQDLYRPSAGCIFKNPYNGTISAGKLIDMAGLKGRRAGGAKVSEINANYIINLGNAKFKDVIKLIDVIKKKIKEEFNINLELEIKIWK